MTISKRIIPIIVFINLIFSMTAMTEKKAVKSDWTDSQKLDSLCEWAWKERRIDIASGREYIKTAMEIAEKMGDDCKIGKVLFYEGSLFFNAGDASRGIETFRQAAFLIENCNDEYLLSRIYNGLGLCNADMSNFTEAISYYQLALDIYVKTNDEEGIALQKQNIGVIYFQVGQLDKAIKNYLEAASILENMDNPTLNILANNYVNLAIIYHKLKEIKKSIGYYWKAVRIYEKCNDKLGVGESYTNLAVVYFDINLDSSYFYHFSALNIYKETGNIQREGLAWTYLADIYRERRVADTALAYYTKSIEMLKGVGFTYGLISGLSGRGILLRETGSFEAAIADLKEALDSASSSKALNLEESVSLELANTYQSAGMYKEAYEVLSRHKMLSDSLLGQEKIQTIKNLEFSYETEKKQQEIDKLNNEKRIAHIRFYSIIAISVLLIAFLLIIFSRQKTIKNKKMALMEATKMLAETKLAAAQTDIEMRKKLLLNYVMRISEKNDLFATIRSKLTEKKQIDKEKQQELISILNSHLLIPGEKQELEHLTKQAGQVFFSKLDNLSNDLKETEKKVCVFLSLGLSSKDMASILNISPATIDNYRSNIRKKLNLDSNIGLEEFLKSL
ncbi:MAG: tetratricopeptide repeat protein [Bacteroidales bacterium]|nr:tetratricopeptide repeat protein [Bacteroidales bacterium]